jgi:hypothetical protein
MEGHGVFKQKDGVIYDGSYHDNLRDGQGELYFQNGSIFRGLWAKGELKQALTYDDNDGGKSPGTVSLLTADESPQPSAAPPSGKIAPDV